MHFVLGWPSTYALPHPTSTTTSTSASTSTSTSTSASTTTSNPPIIASTSTSTPPTLIRSLAHNADGTLTAVVTASAVYIWSFIQGEGICCGVWRRTIEQCIQDGENGVALWQPHANILAVTTTRHVVNLLRITIREREKQQDDASWHDEITLNAPPIHPVQLILGARVNIQNDRVTCACTFDHAMLLGTQGGFLQVVTWTGEAGVGVDAQAWLQHAYSSHPPSAASSPTSSQQHISTFSPIKPAICDVTTSTELQIIAFVLTDGRAGVFDSNLLREKQHPRFTGRLLCSSGATRVAINPKHRIVAVGLESGDVSLYRMTTSTEASASTTPISSPLPVYTSLSTSSSTSSSASASTSSTSTSNPSLITHFHLVQTLTVNIWGFTAIDTGAVSCMEWSPDLSSLAVGWRSRGLVIWSAGGCRTACTLPQLQSRTPSMIGALGLEGLGHMTYRPEQGQQKANELLADGVAALAWCSGGFNLVTSNNIPSNPSIISSPLHILIKLTFVRSCLASDPSQTEPTSLVLLGQDRVLLWRGRRGQRDTNMDVALNGMQDSDDDDESESEEEITTNQAEHDDEEEKGENKTKQMKPKAYDQLLDNSDIDWEQLQVPSPYLVKNWPLVHVALSSSGQQMAIAGKHGVVLYNRKIKRWRVFGNVNHESLVSCLGLAWYGEHIVVIASAGHHSSHINDAISHSAWTHTIKQQPVIVTPTTKHIAAATNAKKITEVETTQHTRCSLLFYPRNHLDNSSLLHTHHFHPDHSFHTISISDDRLMIHLITGTILIYRLQAKIVELESGDGSGSDRRHHKGYVKKSGQPVVDIPYRTTHNAHESLGSEHEIHMTMTLTHLIDVTSIGHALQSRLWLHPADQVAIPREYDGMKWRDATQCTLLIPTSSMSSTTTSTSHANGRSKRTSIPRHSIMSIAILNSTGDVYVVDVGSRALLTSTSTPATPTPSTSSKPTTSSTSPSSSITGFGSAILAAVTSGELRPFPHMCWLRCVAHGVDQIWLHGMASIDSMHQPMIFTPFHLSHGIINPLPSPRILESPRSYNSYYHTPMTPATPGIGRTLTGTATATASVTSSTSSSSSSSSSSSASTPTSSTSSSTSSTVSAAAPLSTKPHRIATTLRLFTYGQNGLEVWFRCASPDQPSFLSSRLFEFDAEVYPLGIDSRMGVIVGLTKGVKTHSITSTTGTSSQPTYPSSTTVPGSTTCFRLQPKLQPYLHAVLRYLVTQPPHSPEYALHLANACRCHEYFSTALELLLHTSLIETTPLKRGIDDEHIDMDRSSPSVISLSHVIDFLRRFPEFPDVVVQCARKNDSSLWPRLFSLAGHPIDLFNHCLTTYKFQTASCYLLVIQRTMGVKQAQNLAVKLLEQAWASEQELMRSSTTPSPNTANRSVDGPTTTLPVNASPATRSRVALSLELLSASLTPAQTAAALNTLAASAAADQAGARMGEHTRSSSITSPSPRSPSLTTRGSMTTYKRHRQRMNSELRSEIVRFLALTVTEAQEENIIHTQAHTHAHGNQAQQSTPLTAFDVTALPDARPLHLANPSSPSSASTTSTSSVSTPPHQRPGLVSSASAPPVVGAQSRTAGNDDSAPASAGKPSRFGLARWFWG